MSITIVMAEGKTLYIQDATTEQVKTLRDCMHAGVGAFQFTLEDRSYIINCATISYLEVTPATIEG